MESNRSIDYINVVANTVRRMLDARNKKRGISGTKFVAIHYIYSMTKKNIEVHDKNLCQRFNLSRSSVTEIVQTLEVDGYVKRKVSDIDKRLKTIIITEKGIELFLSDQHMLDEVNDEVFASLTSDEKKTLNIMLCKVIKSIEEAK